MTRSPTKVTSEILRASSELGLAESPTFVPIEPMAGALPNRCIFNVRLEEARLRGNELTGWKVYEWPGVLVEFIGHAVLRLSSGELLCVTPDKYGDSRILFVAAQIPFDELDQMARMPSKRVPSSSHEDIARFIEADDEIADIKHKYPPTAGQIEVFGTDALCLQRFELRKARALRDILLRTRAPHRKCICGSGKRFAACCRPKMANDQRTERAV